MRVAVPSLPDYDWLDTTRTDRYPIKTLNKIFNIKSNSAFVELRSTEFYYRKKSFSGLTYIPYPGRSIFGTGLVTTLFNTTEGTVPPDSYMNWLKTNADYYGFAWTDKLVGDPRFPYVLHYYKGLERPQFLIDKFKNTPNPSLPPIGSVDNPSVIPIPGPGTVTPTTLPPRGSIEITVGSGLQADIKSLKLVDGTYINIANFLYARIPGQELMACLSRIFPRDIMINGTTSVIPGLESETWYWMGELIIPSFAQLLSDYFVVPSPDEVGRTTAVAGFLSSAIDRTVWHYPPSDTTSVDDIIPDNNFMGPPKKAILSKYGTFSYDVNYQSDGVMDYLKYTTICYLTGHKQSAVDLRNIILKISRNKNIKIDLTEVLPGKISKKYKVGFYAERLPATIKDDVTYNSMVRGATYYKPYGTELNNLNYLYNVQIDTSKPLGTAPKTDGRIPIGLKPWQVFKFRDALPDGALKRNARDYYNELGPEVFLGDISGRPINAPYTYSLDDYEVYLKEAEPGDPVFRGKYKVGQEPFSIIKDGKKHWIRINKLLSYRSKSHGPSPLIIILGRDWDGAVESDLNGVIPKFPNKIYPGTNITRPDNPKYNPPNPNAPKGPSIIVPPPTVKPSTTTTPSTTNPSTTAPSRPIVVSPKPRPDDPKYNPPSIIPKPVPVSNPIPLILGDSIALGIANLYENRTGNESNNIVPNIFSEVSDNDPTKWNGKFQRQGENLQAVFNRMTKALAYLNTKNQARNRIVWLSTGTANSIGQTYASTQSRNSSKAYMTSWIIQQFNLLKSYNATVTVFGIASDQDNLYSYYMNNYMEDLCKKYNYKFVGRFRAGGDDVHPIDGDYGPILDQVIPDLPTDVEVIPPTTTVPKPTTTIPTTTVPATTTTIPSTGTTTRTWIPAAPGARPGAGAAGIGAPRPIVAPTTTVPSTTTPSTSTPSTTIPRQQSTTTTVVGSNGVTTTTTIVFPPKIPVLPPYTPGTTTTTTPNGVTTTTVVASNGVTTTTIVIPPTIEGGSPASSTTSIPPTTSTTVVSPGTTIPPRVRPDDPQYNPTPSVPVPKLNSFDIISLTAENDPNRTNIDVSIVLNFDQEMVRNVGTVIFYKKNTTKALAKIGINSAEIDFVDSKTISITPKNVLPYDTEVSVIFPANIFKSKANKSWGGNPGNHNYISFTTIKDPNLVSPDVPAPKPKPKPKDPEIPELPIITPPIESGPVVMPDKPKPIADPVENEKNLQSNDGLWKRGTDFVDAKITSLKQDVQIVQIAPHTSWVFEFNVLDDAGVIKNIGRIGLERDVPKCVGDEVSPFVCFFTMYGGFKAAPDTLVDRYRQAPCANPVSDYGPGMTLRNKLIWRVKDTFEFRVSYVSAESQEYVVKTLCTSTTRPIDPAVGDTIYESDTDDIYVWTGLAWMQLADATLNIAQGKTFENPNTFIVNGTWWSGMVWNKTLRRTYPLGNIFVPSNYTNIDATKDYVKYSGPESGKTNAAERKASSNFTPPLGFNAQGLRGRYEEQ